MNLTQIFATLLVHLNVCMDFDCLEFLLMALLCYLIYNLSDLLLFWWYADISHSDIIVGGCAILIGQILKYIWKLLCKPQIKINPNYLIYYLSIDNEIKNEDIQ